MVSAARAAEGNDTASGARAYVIVDAATGHILAGKDADAKLQVASLTKVATAAVVLDWAESGGRHGALETLVPVPASALAGGVQNPVGWQAEDQATLRDLLYAALLQSDNIAADTLAAFVGAQISGEGGGGAAVAAMTPTVRFVAQMNALARSLGMERTRFLNPTGIDAQERPYSTAADLARLMRYALNKASFKFFVAQKERTIAILRGGQPVGGGYRLRNTNELLGVKNVDGGKTGQTTRAGNCLIVTAAREPLVKQTSDTSTEVTQRRLIVVVLGAADRFREASALLDRGTALYDAWAAAGRPEGGSKERL
ncbi:MAG: D-alanyl-D-alanine carboxypeptidase [Verrucomicrobia bacterium]|nr:D-alanyl-D-alanine carboxypeptidase [Verrucomicrobiota bacterium]